MAKGAPDSRVVAGRGCGTCTLCCKLVAVTEIDKPMGEWCKHCDPGHGCRIYERRPRECRDYYCDYLLRAELSEDWYPLRSKIVLNHDRTRNRLNAYVEPGRPDIWRREPYYSNLKRWAVAAARTKGQVVVKIGKRAIVILPDKDVDLGVVGEDELIVTKEVSTASGVILDAVKMRLDDPRVKDLVDSAPEGSDVASMGEMAQRGPAREHGPA